MQRKKKSLDSHQKNKCPRHQGVEKHPAQSPLKKAKSSPKIRSQITPPKIETQKVEKHWEKHPAQSPLAPNKPRTEQMIQVTPTKDESQKLVEKHPAQSPMPKKPKQQVSATNKRPPQTELIGPPMKKSRKEKIKEKELRKQEKEIGSEEELPIETDPADPTFGIQSSDNPFALLGEGFLLFF